MRATTLLAPAALALAALAPPAALAQTAPAAQGAPDAPPGARTEESQRHVAAAVAAFRARDYTTAIHEFELAYRAAPNPDLWYNLGHARELAGDYEGAVGDFQRYLRDRIDPADRAEVERRIRALQSLAEHRAAARRRQAEGSRVRFRVEGARGPSRLSLDGRELPPAALSDALQVPPGEHEVAITAEGSQEWRARVRVREGETALVFATLAPATAWVTRPRPHVASAILGGLGAASLGVAGYFAARAAAQDCGSCPDAVTFSNRSDILLGVGAGLAVGAAVAFFVERASGRTERAEAPSR